MVTTTVIERWEQQHEEAIRGAIADGLNERVKFLERAWVHMVSMLNGCHTDEQALEQLVLWHNAFMAFGELPLVIDLIPRDLKEDPHVAFLESIVDFGCRRMEDVEDWIERRFALCSIKGILPDGVLQFFVTCYIYHAARQALFTKDQLDELHFSLTTHIAIQGDDNVQFLYRALTGMNRSRQFLRTDRLAAWNEYDAATSQMWHWLDSLREKGWSAADFRMRYVAHWIYRAWCNADILFPEFGQRRLAIVDGIAGIVSGYVQPPAEVR